MRILVLLTDAFGGFGGISRFNRDLLTAMNASPLVERIHAWPRVISEAIVETIPESIVYERAFAGDKVTYVRRALSKIVAGPAFDLVVCSHINPLPLARVVAKARRTPLALVIFGIDAWNPTASKEANRLAGKTDFVLSISEVTADRFCAWSGADREKIFILPCCVELDAFQPGPRPAELVARYGLDGSRLLMTVGRLAAEDRYKGFDEVLEAMPTLVGASPDLKYMIVGDGRDAPRLKEKAAALGIADRVIFAGRVPEHEKADHYRLADVYVMPSSGEGFGIVLLEAAACGIPVIGSTTDGTAEALLRGRLGRLVDPTSQTQLIDAIGASLASGERGTRRPDISFFGFDAFCKRVHAWLDTMQRQAVRG